MALGVSKTTQIFTGLFLTNSSREVQLLPGVCVCVWGGGGGGGGVGGWSNTCTYGNQ